MKKQKKGFINHKLLVLMIAVLLLALFFLA